MVSYEGSLFVLLLFNFNSFLYIVGWHVVVPLSVSKLLVNVLALLGGSLSLYLCKNVFILLVFRFLFDSSDALNCFVLLSSRVHRQSRALVAAREHLDIMFHEYSVSLLTSFINLLLTCLDFAPRP